MAGPNPFEFTQGRTSLHTLDPRCKLFLVSLVSVGAASSGPAATFAGSALLLVMVSRIGISPLALVRQLKYFLVFLGLIVLIRGATEEAPPLAGLPGMILSAEGLGHGGVIALRFFLIMLLGLLMSATTRPSDLRAAVQWFLAPVPLVPEKRVGILISLTLRFLPLILSQADEIRQAIRARCGHCRKNPVKRIAVLSLGLLGKTFQTADSMALAMEARCYTENRTDPAPVPGGREPAALVLGTGMFLVLILL